LQVLATAAIDLHRVYDWLTEVLRSLTRTTLFASLAPELSLVLGGWHARRFRQQYRDLTNGAMRLAACRKNESQRLLSIQFIAGRPFFRHSIPQKVPATYCRELPHPKNGGI
jgi:hypothetical protein